MFLAIREKGYSAHPKHLKWIELSSDLATEAAETAHVAAVSVLAVLR